MKIDVRRTPSTSQNRTDEPSWSLIRLVAPTGTTKNRPMARAIENAIVSPHVKPPIGSASSSSASWALAEKARARKPILSDSTRATMPRITGMRPTRWRLAHETSGSEVPSPSPSGFRTATAHVETPRIMTPSSTAWPPTGASRLATRVPSGSRSDSSAAAMRSLLVDFLPLAAAALEAVDPSAGVHELLAARVEGMAVRADLDVDLALRRAGRELVPAGAADVRLDVLGMDFGLHRCLEG